MKPLPMATKAQARPASMPARRATPKRPIQRRLLLPLAVAVPLALSSGCSTMPKEASVAMGGAMAGAAIGAQHGGLRGALVGAVIGGFLGNRIGAHLDEEDKKKLAELESKSLDSGKPMTFVTNKTKARITVTPEAAQSEAVKSFKLAAAVESHQLKMIAPRDTAAFVDTPVFTDTNDKMAPASTIRKGEPILIVATVEGSNDWAAVTDADVVVGYVPLRYLDAKIVKLEQAEKAKLAKEQADKDKADKKKLLAKAKANKAKTELAATPAPVAPPPVVAKPQPAPAQRPVDAAVRLVKAMGTCKTVTRTIDTGNKSDSFTEAVKYCQEPPPKWKTIST